MTIFYNGKEYMENIQTNAGLAVARVREYLKKPGAKRHLIHHAGVTEVVFRKVFSPNWNPSYKTLDKLEKAMCEIQNTVTDD